jgi:hypothetical protein
MDGKEFKPKSFWKRPEGVTGTLFMVGLIGGGLYLAAPILTAIAAGLATTLQIVVTVVIIAAILYMVADKRMRNLVWYGYKSIMRWITGMFVQLDPIGVLKSYIEDLRGNLGKMNKQVGILKGQMHKLKETINQNQRQINTNMMLANKAKQKNMEGQMVLKSRKAGRLKESNMKLDDLYKKMEVLYRVLVKMYQNSEILLEDVEDQVKVKEQERKAIRASHSAMTSAMNIISGNGDKREMFDMALEAIADDVANKVGEMERFMEVSTNFMDSVDLQNGVFEEEGMKMLEKWEKESTSLLLGDNKSDLLLEANDDGNVLDLNAPIEHPVKNTSHKNQYDTFFD